MANQPRPMPPACQHRPPLSYAASRARRLPDARCPPPERHMTTFTDHDGAAGGFGSESRHAGNDRANIADARTAVTVAHALSQALNNRHDGPRGRHDNTIGRSSGFGHSGSAFPALPVVGSPVAHEEPGLFLDSGWGQAISRCPIRSRGPLRRRVRGGVSPHFPSSSRRPHRPPGHRSRSAAYPVRRTCQPPHRRAGRNARQPEAAAVTLRLVVRSQAGARARLPDLTLRLRR